MSETTYNWITSNRSLLGFQHVTDKIVLLAVNEIANSAKMSQNIMTAADETEK